MQIARHLVDAVRERTDIVEVVSRHVRLERRGSTYVGLCPFHQEKTPSFHVVPAKHLFHCFGCQASGDVFTFLMRLEGVAFPEAVRDLAKAVGVEIVDRELTAAEKAALRERATQLEVLEAACAYYEKVLWTRPEGAPGRAYLDKRALSEDTRRKARLGYAPAGWRTLRDHLRDDGWSVDKLVEAGLVKRKDNGDTYDVFRERVLFPIRDERGRVIGFGGRLLEGDGPKYLNTPETPLYQKSKVLYGLDVARNAIQRNNRVILVEGYFDVLALHEAGLEETVATCGTALTPEHLAKLRGHARTALVLTDADAAGQKAAEKSLPMFLEAGIVALRVDVPGAKDPDELIREAGAGAMRAALEHARPLLDWVIDRRVAAAGGSATGREQVLVDLMPTLVRLPPTMWLEIAPKLRMRTEEFVERLRGERLAAEHAPRQVAAPPPPEGPAGWRPTADVVHLLWLMVHRYGQVADLLQRIGPRVVDQHREVAPIVARLASGETAAAILGDLPDGTLRRTLSAVSARETLYTELESPLALCEVADRLLAPTREARLDHLTRRQERAAAEGDIPALRVASDGAKAIRSTKAGLEASLRARDISRWLALIEDEGARLATESPFGVLPSQAGTG